MKCPVCKTEILGSTTVCPNCKFDDFQHEFLNAEDVAEWMERSVLPYRMRYTNKLNINNNDFLIEDGVLKEYRGKEANVTIPKGVLSIGNSSFHECETLKSIILPSTVIIFDDWCFYGCTNLSSIVIPNGLLSIGNYSLACCTKLKKLLFQIMFFQLASLLFGDVKA